MTGGTRSSGCPDTQERLPGVVVESDFVGVLDPVFARIVACQFKKVVPGHLALSLVIDPVGMALFDQADDTFGVLDPVTLLVDSGQGFDHQIQVESAVVISRFSLLQEHKGFAWSWWNGGKVWIFPVGWECAAERAGNNSYILKNPERKMTRQEKRYT